MWQRLLGGKEKDTTGGWLPSESARDAVAGLGAELCAGIIFTPIDVVKQRLQVSSSGTTLRDVFRALRAERGLLGLWTGGGSGQFFPLLLLSYKLRKVRLPFFLLTYLATGTLIKFRVLGRDLCLGPLQHGLFFYIRTAKESLGAL